MAEKKDKPEGATEWGARREKPVIDLTPEPEAAAPGPSSAENKPAETEEPALGAETGGKAGAASETLDAAEPAMAPPPPEARRTSGASPLVAAFAGAAGGAAVAAAALIWLGSGEARAPAGLQEKIAALEAAVQAKPEAAALAALDKRIAATEAAVAGSQAAAAAAKQASDQAAARAAAAETAAKEASAGAARALAQASAQPPASPASPGAAPLPAPVPPAVDLKPIENRVAALEQRLGPVEAKLAEPKSEQRATASPEAVAGLQSSRASAAAVAAQSVLQALESGRPLGAGVTALAGLGVDEGKLAPLKPYAGKPAPTARQLAAAFAPLAADVARNAAPQPEGLADRLLAAASRVVKVRRLGESEGDDPAALAARIENGLARGELKEALAAWERLPGPARTLSAAFGAELKARVAAEEAARAVLAESMGALAPPKG